MTQLCSANVTVAQYSGTKNLHLLWSLLGTLAALQLLQCSLLLFVLLHRLGRFLLLQHFRAEADNFARPHDCLLGSPFLFVLLEGALLVDATVLHRPLRGQVATLHLEA